MKVAENTASTQHLSDAEVIKLSRQMWGRAERRIGEIMAAQGEAGLMATGGQPYQSTGVQKTPVDKPTLAEAGIDRTSPTGRMVAALIHR
jgi:hypothetical protein